MFHGLGGDRNTMLPIGAYCSQRLSQTRFLPIEAPIDLGGDIRPCLGWFEPPDDSDRAFDGLNPPRFAGLKRSLALVHATIDELVNKGVDPSTIHLFGHSQGGAIALAAALTYPTTLGSVSTIAGYLALTSDLSTRPNGTRFFLHHSNHDDNVSVRWADYAKSFVARSGSPCVVRRWDIKPNAHGIHPEQLDAVCSTIADAQPVTRPERR